MIEVMQTKKHKPPRIILYGSGGTGKSSLAAAFPNNVFINIEDGLDEIEANAFPHVESFDQVMDQLSQLYTSPKQFDSVTIDSLDHLEILVNKAVSAENNVGSISDLGYGEGYQKAYEKFQKVMLVLNALRERHDMTVIILCHGHVKTFNNVSGPDYDRWKLKLRDKNAELFFEFSTLVGFIHMNIAIKKEKSGFKDKSKAQGGTQRVLSCQPAAGHESKNRYKITYDILLPSPEEGYTNLIEAIKKGQGETTNV